MVNWGPHGLAQLVGLMGTPHEVSDSSPQITWYMVLACLSCGRGRVYKVYLTRVGTQSCLALKRFLVIKNNNKNGKLVKSKGLKRKIKRFERFVEKIRNNKRARK